MGSPDVERPLTPVGIEGAERSAARLAHLGLRLDRGSTSPAKRALETARIFWRALGHGDLQEDRALAPGVEPEVMTERLRALTSEPSLRLLIVGHQPDLGHLMRHLAHARVSAAVSFAPGGMARLDFPAEIQRNAGELVWCLKPAELAALEDPDLV